MCKHKKLKNKRASLMPVEVFKCFFMLSVLTCKNVSGIGNHGILDQMRPYSDYGSHSGHLGFGSHLEPIASDTRSLHHHLSYLPNQDVCEPIQIETCKGIGYNETKMPNFVGNDAQKDANDLLLTFGPLIQYGCSSHLTLFLCSAHVPMCTDKVPEPIGPCESLCEIVRKSCEPVINQFGFVWPSSLNCSKFHPENNHEHMCIPIPAKEERKKEVLRRPMLPEFTRGTIPTRFHGHGVYDSGFGGRSTSPPTIDKPRFSHGSRGGNDEDVRRRGGEDSHLRSGGVLKNSSYSVDHVRNCPEGRKIWTKGYCWIQCAASSTESHYSGVNHHPMFLSLFEANERIFARHYALGWALLSLICSFLAIIISFCSPGLSVAERPILYLAVCQIMYSIGMMIGTTSGSSLICFHDKISGLELLAARGMIPSQCSIVFLLIYFFATASTIWWVILCLSWFLSLNERLEKSLRSKEWPVFHMMSWSIAFVLTAIALLHKRVDADELTGVCGVGFQDMDALTKYVIVPLGISLTCGLAFLILGVVSRMMFPSVELEGCVFYKWLMNFKGPSTQLSSSSSGSQSRMSGAPCAPGVLRSPESCHDDAQTYEAVFLRPGVENNNQGQRGVGVCHGDSHHHRTYPEHDYCAMGNSPASVVGLPTHPITPMGVPTINKSAEDCKAIWLRVGIFALVHSIPIACQVATMAYEVSKRPLWESGGEKPNIDVFLLRLNMNLIPGLTAGLWALSTYSWKGGLVRAKRMLNYGFLKRPFKPKIAKKRSQQTRTKLPSTVPPSGTSEMYPSTLPLLQGSGTVTDGNRVCSAHSSSVEGSSSVSHNHSHHHHHHHRCAFDVTDVLPPLMPVLSTNNTFTARGALSSQATSSMLPTRTTYHHHHHHNYPLPPIPSRNPDFIGVECHEDAPRTDAWRRGETIV